MSDTTLELPGNISHHTLRDNHQTSRISAKRGGRLMDRSDRHFENQAVLNPACILKDGIVHMYYRAVREGNHSTIGYCQLVNGEVVYRAEEPILYPEFEYERHGLEDPRVVECEGVYYLLYTAYDGKNARIAYATSTDLAHFQKQGVISAPLLYSEVAQICKEQGHTSIYDYYKKHYETNQELQDLLVYDKDAILFPRKINGKYALIHRVFPDIQVVYFEDFSKLTAEFWREHFKEMKHHTILEPQHWFEGRHIGGGCPPIETREGWLLIYHGVEDTEKGRVYHAAVALLDKNDPTKELARLDYPLFSPEEEWELTGDVNNVVFPSGAVVDDEHLHIYYGAADSSIGVRSVHLKELLDALQHVSARNA